MCEVYLIAGHKGHPEAIVQHKAPVRLEGEVECDEVYLIAGHKGHPEAVKKNAAADDAIDSEADEDAVP